MTDLTINPALGPLVDFTAYRVWAEERRQAEYRRCLRFFADFQRYCTPQMEPVEMLRRLDEVGYTPGEIRHLFFYWTTHPAILREARELYQREQGVQRHG